MAKGAGGMAGPKGQCPFRLARALPQLNAVYWTVRLTVPVEVIELDVPVMVIV